MPKAKQMAAERMIERDAGPDPTKFLNLAGKAIGGLAGLLMGDPSALAGVLPGIIPEVPDAKLETPGILKETPEFKLDKSIIDIGGE